LPWQYAQWFFIARLPEWQSGEATG
jgi:hypothetical protein